MSRGGRNGGGGRGGGGGGGGRGRSRYDQFFLKQNLLVG